MTPPVQDYEQIERGRAAGAIREEISLKVSSFFDAMMMAVEQDDGGDAMRASAEQFVSDVETSIGAWSQGRSSMGKTGRETPAGRHRRMLKAVERMVALVGGTPPAKHETNKNQQHREERMTVPTRSDVAAVAKRRAAEIRETAPELTEAQSLSKAWEDPDLVKRYEEAPVEEASAPVPVRKGAGVVALVEAQARELRKADPKLSQAQAMSKAWENDTLAELYEAALRG